MLTFLKALSLSYSAYLHRRKIEAELMMLTDRELRDLGINRSMIRELVREA